MDAPIRPARTAFAHTFGAEGERDQAISAYSTDAFLFQETHLPQPFRCLQHLQLNSIALQMCVSNALTLCKSDPLLSSGLRVVLYQKDHLKGPAQLFTKALDIADQIESGPKAWISGSANLANPYRRVGFFDKVFELSFTVGRTGEGKDANFYSALDV